VAVGVIDAVSITSLKRAAMFKSTSSKEAEALQGPVGKSTAASLIEVAIAELVTAHNSLAD
jgi:hypothetical protein